MTEPLFYIWLGGLIATGIDAAFAYDDKEITLNEAVWTSLLWPMNIIDLVKPGKP